MSDRNPYQAPESQWEAKGEYNKFTFDACFTDALEAMKKNHGMLAVSTLVMTVGTMVGMIPVLGWFFFAPAFAFGLARFYLNALAGDVDLSVLFSGFQNYWRNTVQMLITVLLIVFASVLTSSVQMYGQIVEDIPIMLIGMVIQYPLTYLVIARLYLAPFFIVEKGMTSTEALGASWQATAPQWLLYGALVLVSQLASGMGVIACCVGVLWSVPFSYLLIVSVYRQIVGSDVAAVAGGGQIEAEDAEPDEFEI